MKKYDEVYGKTSGKRDVVVGPVLRKCVKATIYWTECEEEFQVLWDQIVQWLKDVPTDEAFKEYVHVTLCMSPRSFLVADIDYINIMYFISALMKYS